MRARNIKPSFFTNEDLAECQPLARILFAGMWGVADRNGNLENRPKLLKVQILPHDLVEIPPLVSELAERGLIFLYEVGRKKFINIPSWPKHGRPHKDEPVVHPVFDGETVNLGKTPGPSNKPEESATNPEKTGSVALHPSSFILLPESSLLHPPSSIPLPENPEVLADIEAQAEFDQKDAIKADDKEFDESPPGLAQWWTLGPNSVKGRPKKEADLLPQATAFFEQLIAEGFPGLEILTAIRGKRNRSEYLWELRKRLKGSRSPPGKPGMYDALKEFVKGET